VTNRAGVEAEAVARLTGGVEPPESRAILVQCLNGELSPAVAIVRMLSVTRDLSDVRAAIDCVTLHAAESSRAGDSLVRDRADSLTQLFVDNIRECEEIVAMAENDGHSMEEIGAGGSGYWDAYARHLRQHPPT
jgi:hypothetical protein